MTAQSDVDWQTAAAPTRFLFYWHKQGLYHMSYYPFLPYSQSPVLIFGMLSVYFGDIIGAHTDEQ